MNPKSLFDKLFRDIEILSELPYLNESVLKGGLHLVFRHELFTSPFICRVFVLAYQVELAVSIVESPLDAVAYLVSKLAFFFCVCVYLVVVDTKSILIIRGIFDYIHVIFSFRGAFVIAAELLCHQVR